MYYFEPLEMLLIAFPVMWVISIIASPIIAAVSKKRNAAAWFLLGCIGGPVALLTILLLPKREAEKNEGLPSKDTGLLSLDEVRRDLNEVKAFHSERSGRAPCSLPLEYHWYNRQA